MLNLASEPWVQHRLWESQGEAAKSLCLLFITEPSSSPVALRYQEALPGHRLHYQLQHTGWFRHGQLCYSKKIRICPAHQRQLTFRDLGNGSSQPSPVHPEMAHKLSWVVPAQSGVEVQVWGGGVWRGTSTMQPNHIINAQALDLLRGKLHTGYIQELEQRERGGCKSCMCLTCIATRIL